MKRISSLLCGWAALGCLFLPFKTFSQCSTNLCSGFPDPALSASNACIMCDPCIINGYVGSTATANMTNVPASFCGSVENNQWFAFLAPANGTLSLSFNSYNCSGAGGGSGIQAEIYSTNDCANFESVSNCWSPGVSGTGIITASGLQPYCPYYLMIDGWAGDICEFTITTLDCVAPPPPPAIEITGTGSVCPGSTIQYCIPEDAQTVCDNSGSSTEWTITPPIGSIVGPGDGQCINVLWNAPGNAVVSVTTTNVCFGGSTASFPVSSQTIPATIQEYDYCLGECVECAGQILCNPGTTPVTLQSWLGCDSIINCVLHAIPQEFANLGQITLCAPATYTICDQTFTQSGAYSGTCDNTDGCDSTTIADLAILNPQAIIEPPDVLPCAPGAVLTLNGSASTVANALGASTLYHWTGPSGGINVPTNTSSVAIDQPGSYCLTVTHIRNGVSCANTECVTVVEDNDLPQTPQISGSMQPCPGSTVQYSVTPVGSPAPTSYTWTTSNGTAFTTLSPTSIELAWAQSGTVQVCVTAQNDCGASNPACLNVSVPPVPTASIGGSGQVCPGSGETVDLSITLTGLSPWNLVYNTPNGTPVSLNIDNSPFTLAVSEVGIYTLTSVSGGAGCPGTVSGSASVAEFAVPTAELSGGGSVCQGSSQTENLSINLTGTSPWTLDWAINNLSQAPLTINGTPFTLPIGASQTGNITLTSLLGGDGCDGTVSGSTLVTLNIAPSVSEIYTECEPSNTYFVVNFDINGGQQGSYSIAPSGGILLGNTFTSDPIPSGDGYSFTVSDANNCNPITVSENIVLCNCVTLAGDMPLATVEECGAGPVSVTYDNSTEVLEADDLTQFVLHSGSGIVIQSPVIGRFSSASVSFDAATMSYGTTYYLSAVAGNDDGSGNVNFADPCTDVTQGTPIVFYEIPTATLSGDPSVCAGDAASFSVNFSGDGPWSIQYDDGSGSQVINGITSNPYTLNISIPNSTTVLLLGMDDNHCPGTASGSGSLSVNGGVAVSGATATCNLTGTEWTVTFQISGGDPSSYSATGLPGSIANGIFTSDPQAAGTGYSILADDANGCDPQTVAQTEVSCNCITAVGTMDLAATEQCGDAAISAVYHNFGEMLDPDDVLIFILHTNSGTSAGLILAKSDDPIFAFDPATMSYGTTYFISAVAGNSDSNGSVNFSDPCTVVAAGTPVTFFEIPTATLSGSASICQGDSVELSIQLTGEFPWELSLDGQVFSNINTPNFTHTVMPAATASYAILATSDDNCPGTTLGSALVQVNTPPQITGELASCISDTNTYKVIFNISGGEPGSYAVTPPNGILAGSTFTSHPLESNFNYIFSVDDDNGCGPAVVTGTLDCNCTTDAGSMSQAPIQACLGENINVPAATGTTLDADDVLVYYLHTASGNQLGNVLATSPTPVFDFDPNAMQTGVTYFVSALAGNPGGNGNVDTSDFCLSLALPGTPILWNPLPTVVLVGSDAICEGETAHVSMNMTGTGAAFTISYTIDGQAFTETSNSPFLFDLTPSANTTIALISVSDVNSGCTILTSDSTTILVSENVEAGLTTGHFEACEGEQVTFVLAENLGGEDPDGFWTNADSNLVAGGAVNASDLLPGAYTYTYTVTTSAPCFNDMASVEVVIHSKPAADAGPDHELDCDSTQVILGGNGSTVGVGYAWSGGNVSDPGALKPETTEPGTYILLVTDLLSGCSASDTAVVSEIVTMPEPHVTVSDVSCFGEKDGFIFLDSITNGLSPYLCSFDGGVFSEQKQFTNLEPGQHTLRIEDAAGCERELNFFVGEPAQVNVEIDLQIPGEESDIVEYGDSIVLAVIVTPPFDSLDEVVWTPFVPCDTCPVNVVTPTQNTTYSIMVAKNGCTDEDEVTVFIKKTRPIFVPNAFSPNGDGTNDQLYIFAGEQVVKIKSFLIFNRWGEAVQAFHDFLPNDPAFGWDGNLRGKPMDPAVFAWMAEVEFSDGKVLVFEGDVVLVR